MFQKKKTVTQDSNGQEEIRPVRQIINNKLYDTSKAKKITCICLNAADIPDCRFSFNYEPVTIYRGNAEWFVECMHHIQPVSEDWVKSIFAKYRVNNYIELFGEVEEA